MKKKLLVALSSTLAVAMALPAFAKDHSINGFFRTRFMMTDFDNSRSEDGPTKIVDQRFRAKWTMGLNEYVSVTYYGEVDMQWGDLSYAGYGADGHRTTRNDGGRLGGDTVNLETKNLYLNVKIPDTPVSARVGLQGYADHWNYSLFAADMAGLKFSAKTDMVSGNVAWFKWGEGAQTADNTENDIDLYAVQAAFQPIGGLSLGADFYWLNVNGAGYGSAGFSNADIYWLGVNGKYKIGPAALSGWVAYNFGTADSAAANGDDLDISAFAGSVAAAFSPMEGVKAKLLALYFSGDDDSGDTDQNSWTIPQSGEDFFFGTEGFMLMMADLYWTTWGFEGFGEGAVVSGNGLWAVALTGQYNPPAMKGVYVKGGVGYFSAVEDDRTPNDGADDHDGTGLGTEVFVRTGMKVAETVDVSLNAAYAFLGDYFNDMAVDDDGKTDDPNNPYELYVMVNVPF
ncbi:hypothetical protein [Deferrisoma camini]|uniref:hypothetical protein n=1 Tax=Deferrisoma camini TaxID=1035120 RepID=UPI00046D8C01|nr:hypothetical protein [Deferrisoma camini]